MRPGLSIPTLFGLGAPELIVVLIVVLVFFSGHAMPGGGERGVPRGSDRRLTQYEKQILLAVGAVVALGIGILLWQRGAR